ncbi:MAG: hypothetical protein A3K90_04690 [Pelodictyon luteolum]|uniref:Uncharacterized protein n=1 Tax=Pelodictyon luteolum TaxID=1100 RepID=A0A165M2S6_PELLU|nr:MAG: hypothetical protein A3K90_04690 [Pelodictyon luteolum]
MADAGAGETDTGRGGMMGKITALRQIGKILAHFFLKGALRSATLQEPFIRHICGAPILN